MSVWEGRSKLVHISLFDEAVYFRCEISVKVFSVASGYVFSIRVGYYIVKSFIVVSMLQIGRLFSVKKCASVSSLKIVGVCCSCIAVFESCSCSDYYG